MSIGITIQTVFIRIIFAGKHIKRQEQPHIKTHAYRPPPHDAKIATKCQRSTDKPEKYKNISNAPQETSAGREKDIKQKRDLEGLFMWCHQNP
jgi:hypothetical protein